MLATLLLVAPCVGANDGRVDAACHACFPELDRLIEQQMAAGRLAGAVVLIGDRHGPIYRKGFGLRALPATPMSIDTIFDLASLTKVVATTTAVMQLVEQGALELDQPVARYWPEFGAAGKAGITIRQLLTHESGLAAGLVARHPKAGYAVALHEVVRESPLAAPGSRYRYSDLNFIVLGELVRRVSGLGLDEYARRHVFEPLGMGDTDFHPGADRGGRIAPTNGEQGRAGRVHDPLARRMGGVAGHAGLFGSADDLARFARMLLAGGRLGHARILRAETVAHMTSSASQAPGPHRRGLGWDLAPPPDDTVAAGALPYGHTGFTGTSLWIDPATGLYAIALASRLYPDGRGDVAPLRAAVAHASAALAGRGQVLTGLDVLAQDGFVELAGRRIGLITNRSGIDRYGRRAADLLQAAGKFDLVALFSPEHGLGADRDGAVGATRDAATGLPVYSLYGRTLRPTDAMLEGLDALVFDVQDAGARFYTYASTLAYAMEAAARRGLDFYVLDRPDPIDAASVQGPLMDPALASFTGYFPLPTRHGMTIGELATLFNAEKPIGARLHVVRMKGYARERWYDETGLAWVPPSPNLRTLTHATLYPGVAMAEGANVSVGRGTEAPFELLGAPWIDGEHLAGFLARRPIPGVRFEPVTFQPKAEPYAGAMCRGVRIVLEARSELDSPYLGVALVHALWSLYPQQFRLERTLGMVGAHWVLDAIRAGDEPQAIRERWGGALEGFRHLRARYLLYPAADGGR